MGPLPPSDSVATLRALARWQRLFTAGLLATAAGQWASQAVASDGRVVGVWGTGEFLVRNGRRRRVGVGVRRRLFAGGCCMRLPGNDDLL